MAKRVCVGSRLTKPVLLAVRYNEEMHVHGLHHITAIASNPKVTFDFYTKTLGLRLVKKSVNQDDVATYHLFFGDRTGEPGMDLTFFTFQPAQQGVRDAGQVNMISLAVPLDSLEFWQERFQSLKVKTEKITERFGYERFVFYDPDDQRLELVGIPDSELAGLSSPEQIWTTSEISMSQAIRCFHSARLAVAIAAWMTPVLDTLGYTEQEVSQDIALYALHQDSRSHRAQFVELEEVSVTGQGFNAAGTVHHIAFEVPDDAALRVFQARLMEIGLSPTPIIDRYYFHSVYFRTRAGILCELATSGPGFVADEDENHLGERLALPPFLEDQRAEIEANLEPLETPNEVA